MRASRLVTLLALVPAAAALAQPAAPSEAPARPEAPAAAPAEPAARSEGGAGPTDAEREAASQVSLPEGGDGTPATQSYTVQKGDTLWDLSSRFLANPWYWPKVWSYNPQITNPHFIYPGNVVRFQAGGEAPGRVVPGDGAPVLADEDFTPPHELDDFSRADMKKPQEIGDGDEVAVVGPYKIGYVPPKGVYARRDSFVTRRELEESGTVTAAFEDKLMLSLHDRAYVHFAQPGKVKKGETYVLYKTDREVRHPVTKEVFGFKSTIIGAAKVVAVDDRATTIQITQAFDPIERGALVGPWAEKIVKQVQRRPNGRAIDGVILTAQDLVSEIGEHHVVFVDKGRADGVEEGNVFTVVRSGDPYGADSNAVQRDPSLPQEDIGVLLVVDAQQTSSATLVLRSLRELLIGDRVEMRPPAPAAGSAGN